MSLNDPNVTLKDALSLLEMEGHFTFEDPSFDGGEELVVHHPDVARMVAMGLGHLPVDSIATPREETLLSASLCRTSGSATPTLTLRQELDVSHHLGDFFPNRFVAALYELQSMFHQANLRGYVIGGIARDLILTEDKKLTIQDVDVTVEGDALAAARFIQEHSRNFRLEGAYPEFGTAKIRYKNDVEFDLASTRREGYDHCGALPTVVERGVPLVADLVRRDFTINTLALSIHDLGKVLDHTGGIPDIEAQRIHVLHGASFFEDPTRILRAFYVAVRLGFRWSRSTERLMEKFLQYAHKTPYHGAGSRVKDELKKLLSFEESEGKQAWVTRLVASDALRLIDLTHGEAFTGEKLLPRLTQAYTHLETLRRQWHELFEEEDADWQEGPLLWETYLCLFLLDLPEDVLTEVASRLGLARPKRELVETCQALREKQVFQTLSPSGSAVDLYNTLYDVPPAAISAGILTLADPEAALEAWYRYQTQLARTEVELDGHDLKALGVPPGVAIGKTLNQLLEARLLGTVQDQETEIQFVKALLSVPAGASGESFPATSSQNRDGSTGV